MCPGTKFCFLFSGFWSSNAPTPPPPPSALLCPTPALCKLQKIKKTLIVKERTANYHIFFTGFLFLSTDRSWEIGTSWSEIIQWFIFLYHIFYVGSVFLSADRKLGNWDESAWDYPIVYLYLNQSFFRKYKDDLLYPPL
jgi:hypothetical protein